MKQRTAKIDVFANDANWQPSRSLIRHLIARMRLKGLRTDWRYCHATEFKDLIFQSADVKDSIEARKLGRRYFFYTDSGQRL